MRIDRVLLHQVVVPMCPDTVHSPGTEDRLCAPDPVSGRALNFWEFPKWIVELIADDGTTGLGEPRRGDLGELLQRSADLLVGRSLEDLPPGNLPLPHGDDYESYIVYEAFEMAWYDLLGKHLGVPVCYLLGGKRRDTVGIDFWMGRCTPEDTARRAAAAVDLGYRGVKMKCALGDPIAERVRAVRQAAPDWPVVLDPNERFADPDGARQVAETLRGIEEITFESPVPQDRLDWYVELRACLPQRLALHLTSWTQLLAALRADAADDYNLLGTLTDFCQWARLTEAAGHGVWRGTGMDLGVRDVSSIHAAAAAGCRLRSDIIGHRLREDDLIVEAPAFVDGALVVPDAPGLGVELDREALARYIVG